MPMAESKKKKPEKKKKAEEWSIPSYPLSESKLHKKKKRLY
jgi:hypothetical protein